MKMNELIRDIHENAVAHGWWDGERGLGEIFALFHSELSEALEEYRAGRGWVWYDTACADGNISIAGKPEGIAVELIDCVIRILDFFGKEKQDFIDAEIEAYITDEMQEWYSANRDSIGVPDIINELHCVLVTSYLSRSADDVDMVDMNGLIVCMSTILTFVRFNGYDPVALLMEKHEYNRTRPYKHGGKLC